MVNKNKLLKSFFVMFLVFGAIFFTGCSKNENVEKVPVVDNAYTEDKNQASQEEIIIEESNPSNITNEEVFQDEFINPQEDVEIGQLI